MDYASREAVEGIIATLDPQDLICRGYGHDMWPYNAVWNAEYRYYTETVQCSRCDYKIDREISEGGRVLASLPAYRPATEDRPGYLLEGIGRPIGDAKGPIRIAAMKARYNVKTVRGKKAQTLIPRSTHTREALGLDTPTPDLRVVDSVRDTKPGRTRTRRAG